MTSIETKEITCSNGMPAFLAKPAGSERRPVVVLMHERYGLVQHTRDLAKRCASDGFAVLAPNFFFRHPDQPKLNCGDGRYDMSDMEALENIDAAIKAMSNEAGADMEKVAVAGYCQTGRHPLVYAAERKITAAIVWYGAASKREWAINERQPKTLDDILASLDCPVFGAFGASDHIIAIEDVQRMRNCLEANKKGYDIHVYADAPHGWLNDTMPGRYRKPQAEQGWADQQKFLGRVLSPNWTPDPVFQAYDCSFAKAYDFLKNVRLE